MNSEMTFTLFTHNFYVHWDVFSQITLIGLGSQSPTVKAEVLSIIYFKSGTAIHSANFPFIKAICLIHKSGQQI